MESQEAGFPPFPHSLEIPSGFPHSHGLDDWLCLLVPLNSNHRHPCKGFVTDVSGPQRNACISCTLTPLSEFWAVAFGLPEGSGPALRAGTGPLRRVAEDPKAGRRQGGYFLPMTGHESGLQNKNTMAGLGQKFYPVNPL